MRVRITKNFKDYKQGQIVDVSPNVAHGLIDSGKAVVSKDMTEADTKVKSGNTSRPSTNKRS